MAFGTKTYDAARRVRIPIIRCSGGIGGRGRDHLMSFIGSHTVNDEFWKRPHHSRPSSMRFLPLSQAAPRRTMEVTTWASPTLDKRRRRSWRDLFDQTDVKKPWWQGRLKRILWVQCYSIGPPAFLMLWSSPPRRLFCGHGAMELTCGAKFPRSWLTPLTSAIRSWDVWSCLALWLTRVSSQNAYPNALKRNTIFIYTFARHLT